MGTLPQVCIIMPVYNGALTIRVALRSLLLQTYQNWNCVIVNDGSTDGTKTILDRLTDPRFRVYHLPENHGRGYARQVALEHAEGDYLAYLDADDFFHCDKLKCQVEIMMSDPDIDLVACALLTFGSDGKPINTRAKIYRDVWNFKDGTNLLIAMSTAIIKLDRARCIAYNSKLNAGEDLDYFSRYLDGGRYVNLDRVLFYYFTSLTTYRKMLVYTYNDCLRCLFLMRRNLLQGMKGFLVSLFKLGAYAVGIPIFGVDYFIGRRGTPLDEQDVEEYYVQLETLTQNETSAQ